jgi:hypothetical protein
MVCKYCKYYEHHSPTWQDPYEEEYCNKHNLDFSSVGSDEIDLISNCGYFEIDEYWKKILRQEKLKRILDI